MTLWHLAEGMELDEGRYAEVLALKRQSDCLDKALLLLGMREHSAWELRRKLSQRGFTSEEIAPVVDGLRKDGSLSDERYARVMVASRQRRSPEGKLLLVRRLLANGVARDTARMVVDEAFAEHEEAYLALAWEQTGRTTQDRQKRMMKMQRKGFTYAEIRKVADLQASRS